MRYSFFTIVTLLIIALSIEHINAQCTNTSQYPASTINAPNYQSTVTVTTVQFAGEYFEIADFNTGKDYTFSTTAVPEDYITIRDLSGAVVGHGPSPFTLNNVSHDTLQVHINLVTPPCGSQASSRVSSVTCVDCPISNNVGIGTTTPSSSAILEIRSTTQGVKFPSLNSTQIQNLPDPVDGLIIHDADNSSLAIYNQSENSWNELTRKKTKKIVISGMAFFPKNDDGETEYYYTAVWGRFGGSPSLEFRTPITLPVGSKLSKVIYYFRDVNTTYDLTLELRSVGHTSSVENVLSTTTSSATASGTQTTELNLSTTIDENFAYFINAYTNHPSLGFPSMGIKAVVLEYTEP